ncbi:hypothetical protein ACS0TY_020951 [Phlomoides rotata]
MESASSQCPQSRPPLSAKCHHQRSHCFPINRHLTPSSPSIVGRASLHPNALPSHRPLVRSQSSEITTILTLRFDAIAGIRVLSDAWALDTAQKPYVWQRLKLNPEGNRPTARMYATGSARADGMFLLCGGRDASGTDHDCWLVISFGF